MSVASPAHVPKLAALQALAGGRLSGRGQARLSLHLAGCALCRRTQRGMKIHRVLVEQLREQEPVVDFERMQLALRREAVAAARQSRPASRLLPKLAVAAALALALGAWLRGYPERHAAPTARSAGVPVVVDQGASVRAQITALVGHGLVRSATGQTRELTVRELLVEGESLELAAGSQAHVRVAEATGFVAEEGSKLALTTLRDHSLVVELRAGAVTSQVRHLGASERYEVHAAGYAVAVRGTHFRVSLDPTATQLTAAVSEGHVSVTDVTGRTVSELFAPASFESAHGGGSALVAVLPAPRIAVPPLAAWPTLSLAAWPDARTFTIDGTQVPAGAELAMRVPAGDVTLRAELRDGRERELVVQVPEGGLVLEPDALRRLLRAPSEGRPSVALDPTSIRSVLTAGMPALQRCYELGLKQRPDISGRFTLRIAVDPAGQVHRVTPQTDGTNVPDELLQCIRGAALRWRFPAPGGAGVTFDAPIRLAQGK